MADLTIANTVSDLIQGDVREHLPLERIPLKGMCWASAPPPASTTVN